MSHSFWTAGSSPSIPMPDRQARSDASNARREAAEAAERLDKLTLICWAMWSLLQEKVGLTEEQLLERVKELDLLDGTADGKATRQVARCSKCDRVMAARHIRCMYCGNERLMLGAFDAVL